MINISDVEGIVREASSLMVDKSFETIQKDGYSNIVTSSDLAVQEFLCERLAKLLPGCGFLCEEEDMNDQNHEFAWIIDPIDGTANYARGVDQCAICVGLRHFSEIVMGVVFLPRTSEMFTAEKGKGSFLNGTRIHVSSRPFADSILCTAISVYHKEYTDVCARIIVDAFRECNDIRRMGAAAPEICYLAAGRFDMYFEYLLSPWDYAAASLVLEEAGGCLSDREGKPLSFSAPSGVLGANSLDNLARLQEIVIRNCKVSD